MKIPTPGGANRVNYHPQPIARKFLHIFTRLQKNAKFLQPFRSSNFVAATTLVTLNSRMGKKVFLNINRSTHCMQQKLIVVHHFE